MKSKALSLVVVLVLIFATPIPSAHAIGGRQAGASLLLPTTGQAMNGEFSTTKSKVMMGIEIASITTIAILGGVVGGGVIWAGLGPLIANHIWSSTDAYQSAQNNAGMSPVYGAQMTDAQRTLEYSRQRRFDREQAARGDLRDRMQQAAEVGYGR